MRAALRLAFDHVTIPSPDELPEDFRVVAGGKHWAAIGTVGYFLHRAALATLSPPAFVAYIAGFMTAALVDGPYETDLLACARDALSPQRLAWLDDAQRATSAQFCAYATQRASEAGVRDYTRRRQLPRMRP